MQQPTKRVGRLLDSLVVSQCITVEDKLSLFMLATAMSGGHMFLGCPDVQVCALLSCLQNAFTKSLQVWHKGSLGIYDKLKFGIKGRRDLMKDISSHNSIKFTLIMTGFYTNV